MERISFEDIDIYSVLSSMHEGVVIADITGKVIFFNQIQGRSMISLLLMRWEESSGYLPADPGDQSDHAVSGHR